MDFGDCLLVEISPTIQIGDSLRVLIGIARTTGFEDSLLTESVLTFDFRYCQLIWIVRTTDFGTLEFGDCLFIGTNKREGPSDFHRASASLTQILTVLSWHTHRGDRGTKCIKINTNKQEHLFFTTLYTFITHPNFDCSVLRARRQQLAEVGVSPSHLPHGALLITAHNANNDYGWRHTTLTTIIDDGTQHQQRLLVTPYNNSNSGWWSRQTTAVFDHGTQQQQQQHQH